MQSIVSLTSSLRDQLIKCLMTLLPNIIIFLLKKYEFSTKNIGVSEILKFEILTKR